MKSPHTLIKLHERAIRIQEMLFAADSLAGTNIIAAKRYKQERMWPIGTIKHHVKLARKYSRIRLYLITRYDNLIKKL